MWEFEIPWASARVLSPLRAVSGERAGEKGNYSHLTSHECSKPNLALWIWSWEGFGPDGFEPQEQQEHRKQLCGGALFTEPL